MDVQGAFLAKVILHQDLRQAVNARITEDHFTDDRYKRVYGYLLKHWKEYGTSPDISVVQRAFPSMEWDDHPQPLDYFVNALLQRRKSSILVDGLNEAAKYIHDTDNPDATDCDGGDAQGDVDRCRCRGQPHLRHRLHLARSTSTRCSASWMSARPTLGTCVGSAPGFSGIDYVTGGLQPEHFVVLMGIPKSFKSATALAMAIRIHMQAQASAVRRFRDEQHRADRSHAVADQLVCHSPRS